MFNTVLVPPIQTFLKGWDAYCAGDAGGQKIENGI